MKIITQNEKLIIKTETQYLILILNSKIPILNSQILNNSMQHAGI